MNKTLGVLAILALAAGVWFLFSGPQTGGPRRAPVRPRKTEASGADFPIPPFSESNLLNTTAGASYVGADRCAACHQDEHASYLQTSHSRALGESTGDEPPDGRFDHPLSGRSYVVHRQDGQMWHRESLKTADGEQPLSDYPMKLVIGSGNHSRSYLVEDDGFLVESPVTWYTARQAWAMSPGYDQPHHPSFQRAADVGCIVCHAGRVEPVDDSEQKLAIHEGVIGCESCHGPGSLHVAKWNADQEGTSAAAPGGGADADDASDLTIVNPAKLDRAGNEAVCGQCHLRASATVLLRGRSVNDFRPGRPLSDYRIDFALESQDQPMKVVGHTQQMRISRCYQQSETLTCTSCHNPHFKPAPKQTTAYYVDSCLQCHERSNCGLDETKRVERNNDNCVACHMPQVPTDIPHFAFTHHRIAVHDESPPREGERLGNLAPMEDVSHLPEIDRQLALGLAYLELLGQAPPAASAVYRRRAVKLLEEVYEQGLRDPELSQALARMSWQQDDTRAMKLATETLGAERMSPAARANATFILGKIYMKRGDSQLALPRFEQLVKLRRHPHDWLMLGQCRQQTGDAAGAAAALRRAAEIDPASPEPHLRLAELHEAQDDTAAAEKHRARAQLLRNAAN